MTKEPVIPEIKEGYVVWHPERGYAKTFAHILALLHFEPNLLYASSFSNRANAEFILKSALTHSKYQGARIRKVVVCLDD